VVQINIDSEKCDGDGTCVDICPVGVFEIKDLGGKKKAAVVNADACIICRACETQCPTNAITIIE
jgi:NAD-dependent dihydropyrimidine dehydrogenase PreA subunit